MTERCPFSSGNAPGFSFGGEFPRVCIDTCEILWDEAVHKSEGEFESYKDAGLLEETDDCEHSATDYSHDTLQAVKIGSVIRFYTTVDYCVSCETEVSETTYTFTCPNL